MRILVDTNILLWASTARSRLDERTIRLLAGRDTTVLFSAASIWELAIKSGLRRANFDVSATEVLSDALDNGFVELPVRAEAASDVAKLPHHHRDPFDRLIVAQAIAEQLMLITTDRLLTRYSKLVLLVGRQPS